MLDGSIPTTPVPPPVSRTLSGSEVGISSSAVLPGGIVADTVIGYNHVVEARNQIAGNTSYTFASWSDGGGQQHTVTVPETAQSYVATYTATQLPSGLVGAWGFNEASGATVTDSSGSGNNGTMSGAGATRTTAGKYGGAISFNGTTGNVTVPNAASLNFSSSYTLEVTNKDSIEHNFTFAAGKASQDVEGDEDATATFTAPAAGSYPFFCKYHPAVMKGTITVT